MYIFRKVHSTCIQKMTKPYNYTLCLLSNLFYTFIISLIPMEGVGAGLYISKISRIDILYFNKVIAKAFG